MIQNDFALLRHRLDRGLRDMLEAAAALAVARADSQVDVVHLLVRAVERPSSDVILILDHFGIDPGRLSGDLAAMLERRQDNADRPPVLAASLMRLFVDAWVFASLKLDHQRLRSGHLLAALLSHADRHAALLDACPPLSQIDADKLRGSFAEIVAGSSEEGGPRPAGSAAPAAGQSPEAAEALERFTVDLTARAREGLIDPVIGRDEEIALISDILTRRRQNNPILTGEAGVGKTAVVEGFALRVVEGDVPAALEGVAVRSLDLTLLQAGASMRGEFENRLRSVIDAVKASPVPIILFIDEAHTLIGAGGQAGQGDAANLLKPALARGELRTIAATTWSEYKEYFERDAALTRRFQVVTIEEPSEETAIRMLRALGDKLERHHGVAILDEAVVDAVKLSARYITGRQLPDKCISLLDTACARVGLSQGAVPNAVQQARRTREHERRELDRLRQETRFGRDHATRIAELEARLETGAAELAELEARWTREQELVQALGDARTTVLASDVLSESGTGSGSEPPTDSEAFPATNGDTGRTDESSVEAALERLRTVEHELKALQASAPLVHPLVDGAVVAAVVASWTGIPVGRMTEGEIDGLMSLEDRLRARVIGQDHALAVIAKTVQTSRAKLGDPRKPLGVFLLVGTSGVGKTETALALADLLFGGEDALTTINMSEFKQPHQVSSLVGAPPGYVGYGKGGVLTEAVRRRPYSVVLLDEMEKAHESVQDVFYNLFDKGMLRDGEGRDIDFKNSLIVMTSNAGTDTINRFVPPDGPRPSEDELAEALRPELLGFFKPAFLGRCAVIPYFPLDPAALGKIVELNLGRIRRRLAEGYGAEFAYDENVVGAIAARVMDRDTGARNIELMMSRSLLPQLAGRLFEQMAADDAVRRVRMRLDETEGFAFEVEG